MQYSEVLAFDLHEGQRWMVIWFNEQEGYIPVSEGFTLNSLSFNLLFMSLSQQIPGLRSYCFLHVDTIHQFSGSDDLLRSWTSGVCHLHFGTQETSLERYLRNGGLCKKCAGWRIMNNLTVNMGTFLVVKNCFGQCVSKDNTTEGEKKTELILYTVFTRMLHVPYRTLPIKSDCYDRLHILHRVFSIILM